jgi:pimeloyl-ACP methyl ester carboxylesterase
MGRRMADVDFRLLLDHDEFTEEVQSNFRNLLAEVTDCSADDVRIVSIRRGCINVRVRMPDDSAKQFLEMFWMYCQENPDMESLPAPLREFLSKYKVDDFTGRVDIDIHVKSKPKNRAIIFVHGWTGDQDTFGRWPAFFWDEFRCANEVFKYPSGLMSHSPSTVYVADALANRIRNKFADSRLALIAHSLGGLVVRRCIVSAQEQDDRLDFDVRNISFVASPHDGSVLAKAASRIPFISSEQVQELTNSNALLFDLNKRWATWVRHYVPKTCRLQSLFGTADKIVGGVNAIGTSEDVIPILGKDHTNIVKPADPSDDVALTVRRFLVANKFFEDDPREDERLRFERAEMNRVFWREEATQVNPSMEPTNAGGRGGTAPKERSNDPRSGRDPA